MRHHFAVALLSVMTVAFAPLAQGQENMGARAPGQVCRNTGKFDSACNPFGSAAVPHAIDNTCAITGDATTPGDKAQDTLKNNLCVQGPARVLTIQDLTALQKAVDATGVPYGNEHEARGGGPPADRSTLFTKLPAGSAKEGDLVSFIGYIAEAKPGSSETVDCHCETPDAIDVHIAMADHLLTLTGTTAQKDAQLCTNSFVVETIPHKRPAALELTAIQPLRQKKAIVRITGPLLFDASHKPCNGTTPGEGDPSRVTVFEIHPVYNIEVCSQSTMSQCSASSNNWKSVLQK
ncbi:MAG TPA: hypothetical protein VEO19_05895 [Terriglobia bacterium]|nr:hypothetical protein [Terriglobia bacterium]